VHDPTTAEELATMVAAPELLAACEAFLAARCLPDEGGVRMLAAESLVRGAIAKAKGHLWHQ
jgi:hypothetical protein